MNPLFFRQMEQVYDNIERTVVDSDSNYKIAAGDFNADIGTKTKEENFKKHGYVWKGRENRQKGSLKVNLQRNTNYFLKRIYYFRIKNICWTWESPYGETRNRFCLV